MTSSPRPRRSHTHLGAGPADAQTLLADPFQLKLHRETREVAVYNLVVAKKRSEARRKSYRPSKT